MSANQITLLRIILLPIPCIIFIFFNTWAVVGFFIYLFLAFTDYIDGVLARHYGVTDFGSFLDPIADKIMISSAILLLSQANWIPYWVPGILLCRDFFLTTTRTILTVLNKEIKTTVFAKVKTIIQIVGFSLVFLTCTLNCKLIIIVLCIVEFIFWALLILILIKKLSQPYWVVPILFTLISLNILFAKTFIECLIFYQCIFIVGLAWMTAVDYLIALTRNKFLPVQNYLNGRLFWLFSSGFAVIVLCLYSFNVLLVLLFVFFQLVLIGSDNMLALRRESINSKIFTLLGFVSIFFCLFQGWFNFILILFGTIICCICVIKKFDSKSIFVF